MSKQPKEKTLGFLSLVESKPKRNRRDRPVYHLARYEVGNAFSHRILGTVSQERGGWLVSVGAWFSGVRAQRCKRLSEAMTLAASMAGAESDTITRNILDPKTCEQI